MKIILILLIIGFTLWVVWSYKVSDVETLKYSVLEKKDDYEIRRYDKYIEASVLISKTGMPALNDGFRILANYIFGGNLGNQKVSMTSPVLTEEQKGASISMTAPVLTQENDKSTKVVFTMPSKYKLEDLPKTEDNRITFTEISEKKLAAYGFTWYYTTERIAQKKKDFLEILRTNNVKTVGEPIFAAYNGPGTIPFMMRNEILIEVE